MPTEEVQELKGHAPAVKVGGVRVPQRARRDSEDGVKSTTKDDKKEKAEEVPNTTFSPFKPNVVLSGQGQTEPVPGKAPHAVEEVKKFHDKPVPTHQPTHSNRPNVIQQPRK